MTDHIQIGDVAPHIQYTGDGSQTQFAFPFPIFKTGDLAVYQGDTLATETVDYAVSGAGDSAGGTVTFAAAPADGAVVTLRRAIAIARISDFQESGEFRSKVLNDELDVITACLQQVADDQTRSLHLPTTDPNAVVTLPAKAARAGKALIFDADGDVTVSTDDFENQATAAAASAVAAASSVGEAQTAQAAAEAAQTAAEAAQTAAETAEGGAGTHESNAAAYAAAAAAAVSFGLYKTVVDKATDYTVTALDDGALIQVDASAGDVVVTLPDSTNLSADMRVAVCKMDATANTVTVQQSGTDTINGATNQVVDIQYEVRAYVLDQSDGAWLGTGGVAGSISGGAGIDVAGGAISVSDLGVVSTMLAASAVETAKLDDLAVTLAKLAVEAKTHCIAIAVSNEDTDLETGTAKVTFRMPYAFTLTGLRASVTTAPIGADLQVDLNEEGTSVLSTVLAIDAGEKTSTTAATPPVISDSALADDAEMTVDIDQIGSTVAGAGLKVYLIGYKAA